MTWNISRLHELKHITCMYIHDIHICIFCFSFVDNDLMALISRWDMGSSCQQLRHAGLLVLLIIRDESGSVALGEINCKRNANNIFWKAKIAIAQF